MFEKIKNVFLLFIIVLIGFFFRFNNLNWDSNYHLHPDERFLTMVNGSMTFPKNMSEYLDQNVSKLNPSNIGYKFFVYGNLPLVINKYFASYNKLDNYDGLTYSGRFLSALSDLLIIILIYKVVNLLYGDRGKGIGLIAAFIYAISVLPIQLSHFFAVDTFLNFFVFLSFYFSLKSYFSKNKNFFWFNLLVSSLFFGFALASKVTALFILPLNIFFVAKFFTKDINSYKKIKYPSLIFSIICYFFIAYLSLRFADPYYFLSGNLLNPLMNKDFFESIRSLKLLTIKDLENNWYPPMVQWLNKNSFIHSVVHNFVFGMGLPIGVLLLLGIFNTFIKAKKKLSMKFKLFDTKELNISVILIWTISFFIYQSLQVTPTLRYFILIYPFFAIFSAIGVDYLFSFKKLYFKNKILNVLEKLGLLFILVIWPLMFSSIYINENTRVYASKWIYNNLANNSKILGEYWDDPLPMPITEMNGKQFTVESLHVFDPDTKDKWQTMNKQLNEADYYILSSNRGWGSITTVPSKYPLMSKFYNSLLAGNNSEYKLVKKIVSNPSLKYLGIPFEIDDQWSDEAFTVYDHPEVLIFKNVKKQ